MFKIVSIIILALIMSQTLPLYASEKGVVINSYRISGESSTDEYIEVYNSGARSVNLSGWRLSKKTASGNSSNLLTTFPEIYLEPDNRLVIAHENCSCSSDLRYSTSGSVAGDNTVILFSDNGKTVVDKVGFGAAIDFEGDPVKNPEDFEIYSRRESGFDTNNNKADFFLLYSPPKPKEETKNIPPKTETTKISQTKKIYEAKLIVTEFLPNPEGSDSENEFVEIKNIGSRANISGYHVADILGSPKGYKIPEGTILNSGEYMAFFSAKTPISLNNNGDGVEVWDPDKKILDASPDDCGKAPEGMSYALSASGWSWSKTPTPGKANIITPPSNNELIDENKEGEVLSMIDETDVQKEEKIPENNFNQNDRFFGILLIIVAIGGIIFYTLYTNKEKIFEFYHKRRKRNDSIGAEIRRKIKGR